MLEGDARDGTGLALTWGVCASTARFVGLAQAQATAGVTPGRQLANWVDNHSVTDNQTNVGLATAGPGNVCRRERPPTLQESSQYERTGRRRRVPTNTEGEQT
jgi:hypothetical protein